MLSWSLRRRLLRVFKVRAQAAAEELNVHVQRAVKKREQIQQQASEHDKELSALRKLRNEQEPVVAKADADGA